MQNDAAVLAATYAKLINECAMGRRFLEHQLEVPWRDCLARLRLVLIRVNGLLRPNQAPALVEGLTAMNNLAIQALRRAEAGRSAQWLDNARTVLMDLKKLLAECDREPFSASVDGSDRRQWPCASDKSVSVVIPAYNSAATIWRAIDSALAQDFGGTLEVIVVDDASTDETAEVLRLYDGRIRTLMMPANRGVAAARNAGLATAAGEYLAFLDADDEYLPGRLARTVGALEAAAGSVLAYSDAALVDDVGMVTAPSLAPGVCARSSMRAPSIDDLFSGCWWPILPSAVTVRREIMERCGRFEESFAGAGGHLELHAWLRVRELGPFEFIAAPLIQWRVLPALERLEKYLPNLTVLHRLMQQRYGERGERMVREFAMSNAAALLGEGAAALGRKDPDSARRAIACALAHLDCPVATCAAASAPAAATN